MCYEIRRAEARVDCVCFITAGPITKLFAWGGEESGAITAIPFTGLIDANCRFTVYSRSSTNGPVRSYISNFVLEVKLLLFQPWPPPTSARRPTRPTTRPQRPSSRGCHLCWLGAACSTLCLRPTRSSFRLLPTRSSFLPYPAPAEFSACLPCRPTDTVSTGPEPALRLPLSSAHARSQIWALWTSSCIPRLAHLRTTRTA